MSTKTDYNKWIDLRIDRMERRLSEVDDRTRILAQIAQLTTQKFDNLEDQVSFAVRAGQRSHRIIIIAVVFMPVVIEVALWGI